MHTQWLAAREWTPVQVVHDFYRPALAEVTHSLSGSKTSSQASRKAGTSSLQCMCDEVPGVKRFYGTGIQFPAQNSCIMRSAYTEMSNKLNKNKFTLSNAETQLLNEQESRQRDLLLFTVYSQYQNWSQP
jgi:hypothetical protein